MDNLAVLDAVESRPLDVRVRRVRDLWDRLQGQSHDQGLSEGLKAELDIRIEEMDRNPKCGIPWKVVNARVRRRHQE